MRRPEDLPSYRKTRMIQRNKAVKSQFVALSTLFIPNKPLRYLEKPPYLPVSRLSGLRDGLSVGRRIRCDARDDPGQHRARRIASGLRETARRAGTPRRCPRAEPSPGCRAARACPTPGDSALADPVSAREAASGGRDPARDPPRPRTRSASRARRSPTCRSREAAGRTWPLLSLVSTAAAAGEQRSI